MKQNPKSVKKQQTKAIQEFEKMRKQIDAFASFLKKNDFQSLGLLNNTPGTKKMAPKTKEKRPTVRQVVRTYIEQNGPTSANDLFYMAKKKFGGWSRHSLYRVLHDAREFVINADKKYELAVKPEVTVEKDSAAA